MHMNRNFSFLLLLFYFIFSASAYYGDPKDDDEALAEVLFGAFVSLGEMIYMLGGQTPKYNAYNVEEYTFSSNQTLQEKVLPGNNDTTRVCAYCQGYALPDNKTIVVIGVSYPIFNSEEKRVGLGFYDTSTNSWTYTNGLLYSDILPRRRSLFSSAISPKGDALYHIGGNQINYTDTSDSPPYGIIKYDLINKTSVIDMSLEHPTLRIGAMRSCADMLPNGIVVIAFGLNEAGNLYNTSEVFLFDTNINKISIQPISGKAPLPRAQATSTLGPDKSTIYYFGGEDIDNVINPYKGVIYNDVPILDTNTWSWVQFSIPGMASVPLKGAGMTVFGSNKIVISTGTAFYFTTTTIAVLDNVPRVGESIQSSNLRWFTNYEPYDNPHKKSRISDGGIAGMVVALLIIIALITALLWRYVPATRRVATYVQQDMIWSPRSGEPLWAETTRLLVRFILLVLFLAFISYVIYRSVQSPVVSQNIDVPSDSVISPDIRFCFDGFNLSTDDPPSPSPSVTCTFRNGTSCSEYIKLLDSDIHAPQYTDYFGSISCFLFLPGPDFRIIDDKMSYSDSTGTKMVFSFFGTPPYANDTNWGVIYVDFYAPGYDPNVEVFNYSEFAGIPKLSKEEIRQWEISEDAFNLVHTTILKQGVVSTASYSLTTIQKLKKDDGWNYIGFSSSYDESMAVGSIYKDAPQSRFNMPGDEDTFKFIAQLTIQPEAFLESTSREQKVFTLLNAFAQAGGVLGLFVAVQTLLFGFRPQSPWGVVHRWSFGSLRIKLTDRLANYFNRTGTPVPLVNPVSNGANLHHYFSNSDNTYVPFGPDVPSATEDQLEGNSSQENRVKRVEERLQLMELLLKSYYLNDEVFRSLDQAVKRGNEEKRRSGMVHINDQETDSVLGNDALNEEYNGDTNASTNVKRRPSSTVFQMQKREPYQPNLTPDARLQLYDEENEIGKS